MSQKLLFHIGPSRHSAQLTPDHHARTLKGAPHKISSHSGAVHCPHSQKESNRRRTSITNVALSANWASSRLKAQTYRCRKRGRVSSVAGGIEQLLSPHPSFLGPICAPGGSVARRSGGEHPCAPRTPSAPLGGPSSWRSGHRACERRLKVYPARFLRRVITAAGDIAAR